MNISPNEQQLKLKGSIARFVNEQHDLDSRKQLIDSSDGFNKAHWQAMSDMGWLKVPFRERDGGTGGSAIDRMILMEGIGKGLMLEPVLASLILSGGLIVDSGSESLKEKILPQLISGELTYASGLYEPQSRFTLSSVATRADPRRSGFSITGRKSVVLNGMEADKILISARTGGADYSEGGITLFLLDANIEGLTKHAYKNVDGHAAADLIFDKVFVDRRSIVGELDEALPAIESAVDKATLAVCSEALGAMKALNKMTLEHCKTRKQFGVALASFQSLQHRMADMLIHYEQAKSAVLLASLTADENNGIAPKEISAAKYRVGVAAQKIAQEAIQLHGAAGVTDELLVSHYFKRLTTIEVQFGNQDYHLKRFIKLSRDDDTAPQERA